MTMGNSQNIYSGCSSEYTHSPIVSTYVRRNTSNRTQQGSRTELDNANDPSASSPTETLLRLLLPLSDKVHETFQRNVQKLSITSVRIIYQITQWVGATGGVYKGQERNQYELMTRAH